jgi:hypothetical protein
MRFAIKSANYKSPPYTADRSSYWECNMFSVTKSEFFHPMRINFRRQKTLPRLRRLFAEVSSLRSSWADPRELHVCGEKIGTTSHPPAPSTSIPLSVSFHQCPYSLHPDTTLYQTHRILKKLYQIVFFCVVYQWSPVATICTIALYIQKPYILPTEYSFWFRMARTKKYFPAHNVCAACLLDGANWISTCSAN